MINTESICALRWLAAVAASEEGAARGSVGLVRWGVAVVVALGGATPGCPRVGIRYSRCPSPTSTWGAATSRHAAVAIILTPSACRRRIAPATSRIPLCRLSSSPLPLYPAVKKIEKRKKENHSTLIKPTTTTTTPTLHATTAHYINHHHVPPTTTRHPRECTSQGKREQGFFDWAPSLALALARSPSCHALQK